MIIAKVTGRALLDAEFRAAGAREKRGSAVPESFKGRDGRS